MQYGWFSREVSWFEFSSFAVVRSNVSRAFQCRLWFEITNAEDEKAADTEQKAECEQKAADAKAQYEQTDEMNKNDEDYLSQSKTMCTMVFVFYEWTMMEPNLVMG